MMNANLKTLSVKYRNGRCRYASFGGSAAMVQQVLDLIYPEMVDLVGQYKWSLVGSPGDYAIKARYSVTNVPGSTGFFFESRGKTPGAALRGCWAARAILRAHYDGNWS